MIKAIGALDILIWVNYMCKSRHLITDVNQEKNIKSNIATDEYMWGQSLRRNGKGEIDHSPLEIYSDPH